MCISRAYGATLKVYMVHRGRKLCDAIAYSASREAYGICSGSVAYWAWLQKQSGCSALTNDHYHSSTVYNVPCWKWMEGYQKTRSGLFAIRDRRVMIFHRLTKKDIILIEPSTVSYLPASSLLDDGGGALSETLEFGRWSVYFPPSSHSSRVQ